jgi:hypothetical protein
MATHLIKRCKGRAIPSITIPLIFPLILESTRSQTALYPDEDDNEIHILKKFKTLNEELEYLRKQLKEEEERRLAAEAEVKDIQTENELERSTPRSGGPSN